MGRLAGGWTRPFTTWWHNDDSEEYGTVMRLLDGRYTFLEEGILDPSGDDPWIASSGEPPATAVVLASPSLPSLGLPWPPPSVLSRLDLGAVRRLGCA